MPHPNASARRARHGGLKPNACRLTSPSSGRPPAGFASLRPPLMSDVRQHEAANRCCSSNLGSIVCSRTLRRQNYVINVRTFSRDDQRRLLASKRCEKLSTLFVEKQFRAPPHLRHELNFSFRISGQSIVFFEVRPSCARKDVERLEHLVAKATYNKTKKVWRVFWRRADGKWHVYPPETRGHNVRKVP